MIKYSERPNDANPLLCAKQAVLPIFCKEGWQDIVKMFASGLSIIWSNIPYGDPDTAKSVRKSLLSDITNYIHNNEIRSPVMQFLSQCTDNMEINLQLMFSFADSPKFLIYKEKDLHQIADEIEEHMDEINAITYTNKDGTRICPYDVNTYHSDTDLVGTLFAQKDNIISFLISSIDTDSETAAEELKFYQDNANKIIDSIDSVIDSILTDINDYQSGVYVPTVLEKGFFDTILYVRDHLEPVEQKMHDYAEGNATADMFTLSESKSPITDSPEVMYVLHKLGFTKPTCPAVMSNIFYNTELKSYGISKQLGQVDIEQPIAFHPAPGLGPAFKIRWVYSVETAINNILDPLAKLIQKADKICDPNEAYNDQLKYLLANLTDITDAYCTDSTGYSDYLFRVIYYILLQKFYGCGDWATNMIMNCLRIPIKVKDKIIPVEFGAMQGEKLLVFIMNHANRLMGLIADRIQLQRRTCIRPNAGDDVTKAVVQGPHFELSDLLTEITVFACFNSPCNISKTAWLWRDGYFDFCSKYFARVSNKGVRCVSGVPAKKYGKEVVCIADWAETFKVLDSAGQRHESCIESFKLIIEDIQYLLIEGTKLPNIYKQPMTVEDKIRNAKNIPYTMGGLSDDTKSYDTETMLRLSRYKLSLILEQYTFNPRGLYLVVNSITELVGTELLKAIGSVNRTNIQDIVKMIRRCSQLSVSYEELKEINDVISRFERNIITAMSHSRTSSTYHRLERNKDVDILFDIKALEYNSEIPLPDSAPEAMFMLSLLTDTDYLDIDNIRTYLKISEINHSYGGLIVSYEGGAGWHRYYGIKDPDNGKIIRLYHNDDRRYPQFEALNDCEREDVKFVVKSLRRVNVSRFIDALFAINDQSVESAAEQYAQEIIEDTMLSISKQQLAQLLIDAART